MKSTTQAGVRNVLVPGERKVRQKLNHLKYPTLRGQFYTDMMFAKVKSLRQNLTAQIFTDGKGYDRFYPMVSNRDAPLVLMLFIHDNGIPQTIVLDNAPEKVHGGWGVTCREHHI